MSSRATQSRPWWFVLIGFWRTIPILLALAAGYAIGAPKVGALVGLAFLVSSFGFSRWAQANRSRLDDRLMMRALTFYFAALAALLVLVALGWLIAKHA